MDRYDIILIAAETVISVMLAAAVPLSEKYVSTKWKLIYSLPVILCLFIGMFGGFELLMLPAYIGSCLPLAVYLKDTEKTRKVLSAAATVCVIGAVPLSLMGNNYRCPGYADDFTSAFGTMKKHYVLAEHKGIDWDSIYDEYLPLFRQADRENDEVMNCCAWVFFCSEFHDGHVYYSYSKANSAEKVSEMERKCFDLMGAGDYGFSMMPLADGSVAAVNVDTDSKAYAAGIHNGTVMTLWDGKDIYEAAESSPVLRFMTFADKDNRRFYMPLAASAFGGENVTVTFISDSGEEQTAVLSRRGNGYDRFKATRDIVDQCVPAANFGWTEIDEKTVCLSLKAMIYDKNSAKSDNYDAMKAKLCSEIAEYEKLGYEKLVIDMRNNGGGSGMLIRTLCEIFGSEGAHYYCTDGKWDTENECFAKNIETGKYELGEDTYYVGEDRWHGKPIAVLVNAECASAGDHMALMMSQMENAVVMGFTESNGSAQGIGNAAVRNGSLTFSNCLVLDRNGDILIDSGTDFESGNDVDIIIPFDNEAVISLFENGEDYVLKKAVENLNIQTY